MKRPSLRSLLVGLIPFVAVCFAVPLWDRVEPMIFGLPFNIFWLLLWMGAAPAIMWWGAYRPETHSKQSPGDVSGDPQ